MKFHRYNATAAAVAAVNLLQRISSDPASCFWFSHGTTDAANTSCIRLPQRRCVMTKKKRGRYWIMLLDLEPIH